MATKKNLCRGCKNRFPVEDLIKINAGKFHSMDCAIDYANKKKAVDWDKIQEKRKVEFNKETKRKKKKLLSDNRAHQLGIAQKWFNRFIRLRDLKDGCISCRSVSAPTYHAGHYKSVGAHPELRFDELNCHKQCAQCNHMRSGNITGYRLNLIKKIGTDGVDWIEGNHPMTNYSIDHIKRIAEHYKLKCKGLE